MSRKLVRLQNNHTPTRRCRLAVFVLWAAVFSMMGLKPFVASAQTAGSGGTVSCAVSNAKNSSQACANRPVVVRDLSVSKIQNVPSSVNNTGIDINKIIKKVSYLLSLAILLLVILACVIIVIGVTIYSFKSTMYKLKKTLSKLRVKHLETQAILGQSERLTQSILTNTSDGIIIFDGRGAIESVSRAAEHFFQYRSEELRGRRLSVLLSGPEANDYDRYLRGGIGEGQGKSIDGRLREVTGRRSDGLALQMEISIKELYLGEGRQFMAMIPNVAQYGAKEFASKEESGPRETAIADHGHGGAFQIADGYETSQQEEKPFPTAAPRTTGILFPLDRPRRHRETLSQADGFTHGDSFEKIRVSN